MFGQCKIEKWNFISKVLTSSNTTLFQLSAKLLQITRNRQIREHIDRNNIHGWSTSETHIDQQ